MTFTRNKPRYAQRLGPCVAVAGPHCLAVCPGQTAVLSDSGLSQSRRVVSKKGLAKTVTRHEATLCMFLQRWVLA